MPISCISQPVPIPVALTYVKGITSLFRIGGWVVGILVGCGVIESFNGRLRDELLNETLFRSLPHARAVLEASRRDYNQARPHSKPGWILLSLRPRYGRLLQTVGSAAASR